MSKHEQMREYLNQHGAFTIKDVVRVTRCNNPYRVIEHMKRRFVPRLLHDDIATKNTWFRVYYAEQRATNRWAKKHLPKDAKLAPVRAR